MICHRRSALQLVQLVQYLVGRYFVSLCARVRARVVNKPSRVIRRLPPPPAPRPLYLPTYIWIDSNSCCCVQKSEKHYVYENVVPSWALFCAPLFTLILSFCGGPVVCLLFIFCGFFFRILKHESSALLMLTLTSCDHDGYSFSEHLEHTSTTCCSHRHV